MKSKGLGDSIEKFTKITGINHLAKVVKSNKLRRRTYGDSVGSVVGGTEGIGK